MPSMIVSRKFILILKLLLFYLFILLLLLLLLLSWKYLNFFSI